MELENQYPKCIMYCRIGSADEEDLKEDERITKLKETIKQLNKPRRFVRYSSILGKYLQEKNYKL